MDKLTQYRHYVKELLQQYASYRPAFGEVEVETVLVVMQCGWYNRLSLKLNRLQNNRL